MIYFDLTNIILWWGMLFLIGSLFLPLTSYLFSKFYDRGYIFSKILGISLISYIIFLLGTARILAFSRLNSLLILIFFLLVLLVLNWLSKNNLLKNFIVVLKNNWKIFLLEESIFLITLLVWALARAHQPDIHNIEKFMDFGFVNAILRSSYFPPKDMWFANSTINYYYFGHLVTAILTKISGINSSITYNLMIASLFSFIFTEAFSIGFNLLQQIKNISFKKTIFGSFLTALLVTLAGNLQTIYAFFTPFKGDNPIPFWQLKFSPLTFPNAYWYPSATRFIYHAIHEFPAYALSLSDLHGHLLDTPFTLFGLAFLLVLFLKLKSKEIQLKILPLNKNLIYFCILSLFLAIMYMTNAWDGLIYFLFTVILIGIFSLKNRKLFDFLKPLLFIGTLLFLFTLPFNLFYKPPISGLAIICPPQFLIGKNIGPLFFENQCQRSPLWTLGILYGFFYFWVISFLIFLRKTKDKIKFNLSDQFILLLILVGTILIFIPETVYFKDIFTTYPRANTMFKIAYQVFIILSISSGYIIIRLSTELKTFFRKSVLNKIAMGIYLFFALLIFFLVSIYPVFAVNSYYDNLSHYYGLNGINYLKQLYPGDYNAILWINKNIKGQPTMLEAQDDSYTDYERMSINTGLPTVIGWTVHEWFWRNDYVIVASRINDVKTIYDSDIYNSSDNFYTVKSGDYLIKIAEELKFGNWENIYNLNKNQILNPSLIYANQKLVISNNADKQVNMSKLNEIKILLKKYNIAYVYIGGLERQKYLNLNEEKFNKLGKLIYSEGNTQIYKIN